MPSLARAYEGLSASDSLVAKATGVSEVAQIARIEKRLREYIAAEWEIRAKKATAKAAAMASKGAKPEAIASAVDAIMETWAKAIEPTFLREVEAIYKLARIAGHKKANRQTKAKLVYDMPKMVEVKKAAGVKEAKRIVAQLTPSFNLADARAIKALKKQQTFWMGKLYKGGVSTAIADTAREVMVQTGQSTAVAGRAMAKQVATTLQQVRVPAGFNGSTTRYFEGVAANATTVARVQGQIASFAAIGTTTYTINNPVDSRTCPRCAHMDGKVFTTKQGLGQMQKDIGAGTPDAVKAAHPWPSQGELKKISPKAGRAGAADSKKLAAAGLSLPPYHFKCRCTVDIDETTSYNDLGPPIKLTPVKPPTVVPIVPTSPLLAGKPAYSAPIGKGVNDAELMRLETSTDNKVMAVWKKGANEEPFLRPGLRKGTYYQREVTAYKMDQAMAGPKIVPETVVRTIDKQKGSLQKFIDDTYDFGQAKRAGMNVAAMVNDPGVRKMWFMDVIAGNSDRHAGNVLFTKAKGKFKTVAIDNGLGFAARPQNLVKTPFASWEVDDSLMPLLRIKKADMKVIDSLSLKKLAKIMAETTAPGGRVSSITLPGARAAMYRLSALQQNPGILEEMATTQHFETLFHKASFKKPTRLGLTQKDFDKIDKILADVGFKVPK